MSQQDTFATLIILHNMDKLARFQLTQTKLNRAETEYLTRAPHAEANARLLSLNALKGHEFVQKLYRIMPLGQIATLVKVNVH